MGFYNHRLMIIKKQINGMTDTFTESNEVSITLADE